MNLAIKIISKTLITKIFLISWGGYDKGFYGIKFNIVEIKLLNKFILVYNENTNYNIHDEEEK